MTGYWRNPEATCEALVDGWLRTGDLARMDAEGLFYIVDRKKDMVITGGENVYPREVEAVLHAMPQIADVAVLGVDDVKWGEAVVAAVVRAPGREVGEAEIVAYCRERLAAFKAPKRVYFVDALPRNASMKVLKRELRAEFEGRISEYASP